MFPLLLVYAGVFLVDFASGFSASSRSFLSPHTLRNSKIRTYLSLQRDDSEEVAPFLDHVPCIIRVIGVGGGGGNAVNHMTNQTNIEGVSFWAVNTDAQALAKSLAPNVLNIGRHLTRGLGAGGNPATGAEAALENALELKRMCEGADLVFITAGMGGGTGSGAAPVLAEIAKSECGCLTIGVVTKPFAFEGRRRMKQAESAIDILRKHVDALIVVSNDKLLQIVPENTPIMDAFLVADDILRQGVIGISDIILRTGLVNVDFADVRAVMKDAGPALMGIGKGVGGNRATDAAIAAISSPLLDFPIHKAKRVVFNIVGGNDLGLIEINDASEIIHKNCDENANIIFGALVDPEMGDEVSITVLACDFEVDSERATPLKKVESEQRVSRVDDQKVSDIGNDHQTSSGSAPPKSDEKLEEPRLRKKRFKWPVVPEKA
jgi:cell division protein FtsZ